MGMPNMLAVLLVTALSTSMGAVQFSKDHTVPENTLVHQKPYTGKYNLVPTVNTTIVMPYNKVAMDSHESSRGDGNYRIGYDGYVYCFHMYASFKEPVKISIWRWIDKTWASNWYNYADDLEYWRDLMKNGSYTLVYMSEAFTTPLGEYTHCMNEAVVVEKNDFLGLTYGLLNPIPYQLDPFCENDMLNMMQTCEAERCVRDTEHSSWGSYNTDYNSRYRFTEGETHHFRGLEPLCRNYALQATVMEKLDHEDYNECELIQLTEQEQPYSLMSQPSNAERGSNSDTEDCWIIRAINSTSKIHIQPEQMDLKPHKEDYCIYEKLAIQDPDTDDILKEYCGTMNDTLMSTGAFCVLYFYKDQLEEHGGFTMTFRSVPPAMYTDYTSNEDFVWPWERDREDKQPESSASSDPDEGLGLSMLEKIGIGIGVAAFCLIVLLLMGLVIYCICCSGNKRSSGSKKKKVHPMASAALPKNKECVSNNRRIMPYYSNDAEKDTMYYSSRVYTIPEQPMRYPPPYSIQPVSKFTPREAAVSISPPPPYTEERYGRSSLTRVVEQEEDGRIKLPAQISLPNPDARSVVWSKRYQIDTLEDTQQDGYSMDMSYAPTRRHQPLRDPYGNFGPYDDDSD